MAKRKQELTRDQLATRRFLDSIDGAGDKTHCSRCDKVYMPFRFMGADRGLCPDCRPYDVCKCGKLMLLGQKRCVDCAATKAEIHRERGGVQRADGYVHVRYPEHARAGVSGYVLEHIYVTEQMLGRALTADETVHHKNGVRHDNRPENLELWASNHPSGQRVTDLLEWARAIIAKYENTPADAPAAAPTEGG